MTIKKFANVVSLLLLTLTLLSCSGQGQKPAPVEIIDTPSKMSSSVERELSLAEASIAPQRQRHQLTAATLLENEGDISRANSLLSTIDHSVLALPDFMEYTLLYSGIALQQDDFFLARELLTNPRLEQQSSPIETTSSKIWLERRGDLFALLGEDRASISAYIALSPLLDSPQERLGVHDKLWRVLTHIPEQSLQQAVSNERNPVLKGWFTLSDISRSKQSDIRGLLNSISIWQQQWPDHPAAVTPPSVLASIHEVVQQLPDNIALLLPLRGGLSKAGTTIRDGVLSARYNNYEQYGKTPSLKIYDSSGDVSIADLYQQAIADGAEMVIGPLEKAHVRELFTMNPLPVPTIALNYVGNSVEQQVSEPEKNAANAVIDETGFETEAAIEAEEEVQELEQNSGLRPPEMAADEQATDTQVLPAPANLYQFGLSTTDEAKQIAERAWIEGQRSALAIVPDNQWGERVLNTFREHWLEKGGVLHVTDPYEKRQIDFAPLLKPALHFHQSEQRINRLERVLGKKLNATPRRRQDLDMVFIVAYPNQARQIKPTLDFLFAGDLQIYGTSQLYSGEKDLGRNRDLEGIRFSAMPWTLQEKARGNANAANNLAPIYRHMFALGSDVYQLHQWLAQMQSAPSTQLLGNTGTLQLMPDNTISRQQPWAVFRGGKVRPANQLTDE